MQMQLIKKSLHKSQNLIRCLALDSDAKVLVLSKDLCILLKEHLKLKVQM